MFAGLKEADFRIKCKQCEGWHLRRTRTSDSCCQWGCDGNSEFRIPNSELRLESEMVEVDQACGDLRPGTLESFVRSLQHRGIQTGVEHDIEDP